MAVVPETLTARADVPTETPERYAKQLVSHLGHRVDFTTDGPTSTASIAPALTGRWVANTTRAAGPRTVWAGPRPICARCHDPR